MKKTATASASAAFSLLAVAPLLAQDAGEVRRLELEAPIDTWDEALPLGNGLIGGLLWGSGNTIRLSLDRGDLWDERLPSIYLEDDWNWQTIRRLVAEGDQAEISRRFDAPYHEAAPTKLPGGRLEITLDPSERAERFLLDLGQAMATVELSTAGLECFFDAVHPVAMLRIAGSAPILRFVRPAGLNALGYEPAEFGEEDRTTWMVQRAARGLTYAVVVSTRRSEDETLIAVNIASNRDGPDPLERGRRRVAEALERGWKDGRAGHVRWWRDFWARSAVRIPDAALQRHYDLVKYFYGSASRVGSPPMPLQGLWTRDDGGLPPWKGDYHHDLNTQMTYLAYHAAGLVEAGQSFLEYNWERLPGYREFARDFYGAEGAAMPGVATLAGRPTGGWSQYALSPTNALWVGHSFYLHWRYTMDRAFLAERAYPWLSEMATCIADLLEERDGALYLPLSSSPEIHDNSLAAWLAPNSNYDQDLVRWAFGACAEMAEALEREGEAARWRGLRAKMPAAHVADDGVLMFAAGEPFDESHRHHSHTMAIHPLGTLSVESSERDRAVIGATLDRMHELGTRAWVGYSFSWFACLLARAGRGDEALRYLRDYERAFTLRNGFHVNGDQIGAGLSAFTYRPFTLEGNFLAMEAVHEMLLQSWGDRLRVFPAVPAEWADVSFERLRAQGGFIVSAERKGGRTRRVTITSTSSGPLRLRDPFDGAPFRTTRPVTGEGGVLRAELAAGDSLVMVAASASDRPDGPPAISLLGEPLSSFPPPAAVLERYEAARRAYEADPDDPDALIWYGRRAAYAGEYREAIEIFTEGIRAFPEDARMYRHRGHRYITVRQLDRAIADLTAAGRRIEGTEDEIEPDGLPNARNIPLSSLHGNVWYHLGLAQYLKGNLEEALEAYRKCRSVSRNDDGVVSSVHWLYMILRRLGREDEARAVIEPIHPEMEIIENTSYFRLCLLYRGLLPLEALTGEGLEASSNDALWYGIGNWHLYNGDRERARRIYEKILEDGSWPSFGYLAAEADWVRFFRGED